MAEEDASQAAAAGVAAKMPLAAAEALLVLLEQQGLITDQQTVCTLLQVSKPWRAAVRQCKSGQVSVSLRPSAANWTSSFAALATWLPSHAGLVGCLLIWGGYTYDEDRQQLQNALLTCSLKAAAPQMLKPWAFSTAGGTMLTAAVVSALPAHSLTALEALDGIFIGRQDALPVVSRISRLTSLQKLYIDTLNELDASDVHGMLTNLPKGLTELTLEDMEDPGNDLQHLPTRLVQLQLGYVSAYGEQPPLATILQRLQKLQHLTVWHWADTALQLLGNLAPQLTQLRKVNVMMHQDAPASALVQAIPFLLRLPSLDQLSLQTKDDAERYRG